MNRWGPALRPGGAGKLVRVSLQCNGAHRERLAGLIGQRHGDGLAVANLDAAEWYRRSVRERVIGCNDGESLSAGAEENHGNRHAVRVGLVTDLQSQCRRYARCHLDRKSTRL